MVEIIRKAKQRGFFISTDGKNEFKCSEVEARIAQLVDIQIKAILDDCGKFQKENEERFSSGNERGALTHLWDDALIALTPMIMRLPPEINRAFLDRLDAARRVCRHALILTVEK